MHIYIRTYTYMYYTRKDKVSVFQLKVNKLSVRERRPLRRNEPHFLHFTLILPYLIFKHFYLPPPTSHSQLLYNIFSKSKSERRILVLDSSLNEIFILEREIDKWYKHSDLYVVLPTFQL